MQTVLVVDDDVNLRDTIGLMLEKEGFRPVLASDGKTGLEQALALKPSLILVDLRMPGLSGVEVCKRLRGAGMKTPLIVLSAIGDEMDKVLLLEIGADDYVVKPFGVRELLARIHALLRRTSPDDQKVVSFSDVEVDLTRRVVLRRGEELRFTRAEYNLLTYFIQNPDRALTRDMILNSVWGYESFPNTRTVDAHVVRLRQKLETDSGTPRHFLTVHGVGYRFPALTPMNRTVLIVEDVEVCRDALELALMPLPDLTVRLVRTAEEALRNLESDVFCVLVTDIHLPQMDGFDLIRQIRSEPRYDPLKIVVISGDTDPGTRTRLESMGANAYFPKPYSPAEVRQKLEQFIDGI